MASYILLSLPLRTFDTGNTEEAVQALASTVGSDNGTTTNYPVPAFKIGTLDTLVQQADELAKLHTGCEGVVQRVADSLKTILEGDEDKIAQNKMVNDSELELLAGDCARGQRWLIASQSPRTSTCGLSAGTKPDIGRIVLWLS